MQISNKKFYLKSFGKRKQIMIEKARFEAEIYILRQGFSPLHNKN